MILREKWAEDERLGDQPIVGDMLAQQAVMILVIPLISDCFALLFVVRVIQFFNQRLRGRLG